MSYARHWSKAILAFCTFARWAPTAATRQLVRFDDGSSYHYHSITLFLIYADATQPAGTCLLAWETIVRVPCDTITAFISINASEGDDDQGDEHDGRWGNTLYCGTSTGYGDSNADRDHDGENSCDGGMDM